MLVGMLLTLSAPAIGQNDSEFPEISGHAMTVIITPDDHWISAMDVVFLEGPAGPGFEFTLNKNLEIQYIGRIAGGTLSLEKFDFEIVPYQGSGTGEVDETTTVNSVIVDLPEGTNVFMIEYSGEINDPINPSTALGRVRGDYTSGIISPEGVYLSSETGWYPDTEFSMATYNVNVQLPEGWSSVSQGNREQQEYGFVQWTSDVPSDGCVLVANQYNINTRTIDGVDCSTYFYMDNEDLSNQFLDKLEEYLPAYVELFGPHPYSRFDIVENFFSTGYGMPGFTLLGSRVLTMPFATAEGSLAHELVHNWWGNYVYVDWESGNWCEGLTSFSTNYYWNVIDGRPEDAEAFRFRSMVRYAVDVSEEEDYPVREFRTKMTAEDGNIGYDKASGIFIMLHEMLGKDKFFEALRLGVERYGGQRTSWDDWKVVFEEVYGKSLTRFFTSWLDQTGAPSLEVYDVSSSESEDGYRLHFFIRQTGNPFYFDLPVRMITENADTTVPLQIFSQEQSCSIIGPDRPLSIEIDPEYYIYRRLTREEIPPGLKTTLVADSLIVVLPSGGTDETLETMSMGGHGGSGGASEVTVREHYESLAEQVAASGTDVTIKDDVEVTEEDLANSSILCFGAARYNSIVEELGTASGEQGAAASDLGVASGKLVDFSEGGFTIDGTEYTGEGNSVLVTVRNPFNPDYDITFYMGNSPQAIFKASYIFFYNWDSYIVYEDGTVIDRGDWETNEGSLIFSLE